MQRLAPQRFLQAIADVAVDLLFQPQGEHADPAVEGIGAVHHFGAGFFAGDGFDQRQKIDRVERMADDHPLGVFAL